MQLPEVWCVNCFQENWLYYGCEKQWLEGIIVETNGQNFKGIAFLL